MNPNMIGTDTIAPRYPHLHPEDLAKRDEAEEAAKSQVDAYVSDWIDGDLVDTGDTYTGPIQRMLDDDLVERLAVMLEHKRAGRSQALKMAAASLVDQLEREIRKDAE